MKQEDLIRQRKEILKKQAEILHMNLDYEPEVVMEDISKAPASLWHIARRSGWGGSDEGALNGIGYSSLQAATMNKVLGVKEPVTDDLQHIFDFGHANEWVMLKAYAVRNGYKFLVNSDYYVIVETDDDMSSFPFFVRSGVKDGKIIYAAKYSSEKEAREMLDSLKEKYPDAYILTEERNDDPKDIRDITDEEHALYDSQGIVCVDRRQYRSPLYPMMLGDCDGICITPSGEKIGIECKTYSYQKAGTFTSGLLGEEGVKIKNPEYALQVAHYMHVLNINRFDIVSMCGNLPTDINITTAIRDLQLEKEICENCKKKWEAVEKREIPEESIVSNKDFSTLLELLTQRPKIKETVGELPDENLSLIREIEGYTQKLANLKKDAEKYEGYSNAAKAKLVAAMQSGDFIYEKALIHENGFDYLVTAVPTEQKRLDEKRLKAQCPELYAEYVKTHSFSAYLEKCEPQTRAEYEVCKVFSPKVKIIKVKAGSLA